MSNSRVSPLNMTIEERRTLLHCILAGQDAAIDHFGDEEAERIKSLKEKLDFTYGGRSHQTIDEQ